MIRVFQAHAEYAPARSGTWYTSHGRSTDWLDTEERSRGQISGTESAGLPGDREETGAGPHHLNRISSPGRYLSSLDAACLSPSRKDTVMLDNHAYQNAGSRLR